MADFLNIPGNVKQSMLPFNLKPDNGVNIEALDAKESSILDSIDKAKYLKGEGHAQMFSFKPGSLKRYEGLQGITKSKYGTYTGQLNICPSSYRDFINLSSDSDISLYSLFDNCTARGFREVKLEESLLDNLPTVHIREYQQDAKLNQVLNLFGAFTEGWKMGSQAGSSTGDGWSLSETGKVIWETLKEIIKNIPTILKKGYSSVESQYKENANIQYKQSEDLLDDYILKIPYLLYYKLMSTFTTNIYEVPFTGKTILVSDGTSGWSDTGLKGVNTSGSGIFSDLLNFFGKNIRISTTPIWDGAADSTGSTYTIQFTLFNDTSDAAVQNFIFINTLFPNNKWLQYHIYQHSPSLYDIKIDGIGRAMLCAGQFECEAVGPLREPSEEIFRVLTSHMNSSHRLSYWKELKSQKLVVIPDAYDVKLTFKSLLPDNFNNYLYQYVMQENFNKYVLTTNKKDLHDDSAYEKFSESIVEQIKFIYVAEKNHMTVQDIEDDIKLTTVKADQYVKMLDKFGQKGRDVYRTFATVASHSPDFVDAIKNDSLDDFITNVLNPRNDGK